MTDILKKQNIKKKTLLRDKDKTKPKNPQSFSPSGSVKKWSQSSGIEKMW